MGWEDKMETQTIKVVNPTSTTIKVVNSVKQEIVLKTEDEE